MFNAEVVEELNNFSKKIMKNENISDYTVNIEGKTEIGDNYVGEIIFFNVIGKNVKNEEKIYNLVMKTPKRGGEIENTALDNMHNRELFMYSKIFPIFKKFCMAMNPNFSFDVTPETYLNVDEPNEESLFFENLKCNGYKLHDRKTPWNLEHSLLTMKNYGKFHGISLALNEKNPELFKKFTEKLPNIFSQFTGWDTHKIYDKPLETALNYLKEAGRSDLIEKYSGILNEMDLIARGKSNKEDKLVICHGDCWNNNFMFKYENEDQSVPSKMCFLDFQLSSFDTPVIDLSYNIYTTCDKENLKNFDLLLKTYHDSLTETMNSLGCTKKPFTFDDLMNQWKKYGKYGVVTAIFLIQIQLSNKEDTSNILDKKASDIDEYKRRMLDLLIHYGDRFL